MKKALRVLLYCVLAATLAGCSGCFGVSPLLLRARKVVTAQTIPPALLFSSVTVTAPPNRGGRASQEPPQGRVTVTPSAEGLVFTPDQGTVSLLPRDLRGCTAGDNNHRRIRPI